MDTDRNLLFAVLALQADFIDRDCFVQACTLWAARKHTSVADLLVEQGWLSQAHQAVVEQLLQAKLRKHGGDVRASLAEAAGSDVCGALAAIADADVKRSIAGIPGCLNGMATVAEDLPTVPRAESAGRNILYEEIGRGGIGRVLRGRDPELRRDLAIKVLRDEYRDVAVVRRRFVEEAQIGGQLQHPGLVPIYELGRFADQRPYFTMKLVKGRTLADLLSDRPEPRHDLSRFVGIFEQVCHTVAYAHNKRVIHRDLKPANIMVGLFGEVQVMDWGLAKVLGSCDGDPEAASTVIRTLRSDSTAEEDGRTGLVGTPAFMAPEQARGEVDIVDARADVFGLGAILCVILTSLPPYTGADREEVLRQAVAGDLTLAFGRLEGCATDRELVALCRRCLAPRPEGRPVDAAEVAKAVAALRAAADERARRAELERVKAEGEAREAEARAAEQRRRRRVLLAASGIITLVLLAGLSASLWQMFRAIDAEGQANQNAERARDESHAKELALAAEQKARKQAFTALRSMTADVVERKFAQGAFLTEDDRAFLRGIIAQYDAFAAINDDDTDIREVRAEGRYRVGIMRFRLGELKEAEENFDEALSIATRLVAEFPARPEFRQHLAASHHNRGLLLRDTGRLLEAEADYEQALSIYKQLAADLPSQPEFRRALALTHLDRGNLLSTTGRLPEAERDYKQGLRIYAQLAADFPARPAFRHDLASTHLNQGNLLSVTGRLPEAEKEYDQALSIYKQLALDFPSRLEFRQHLATSHHKLGNLLSVTRRLPEAEKEYDQALSIQKQLAADFPSRAEFRQDLAASQINRGNVLRATGRRPEAEKDYDQALSIQKQLANDFPSRPEFRRELANSHNNRGLLLRDAGRLQEAEKDYDQALSIRKQLAAEFPGQPDRRNDLAATCVNLANFHAQQGNWPDAKSLLLDGRPHHLAALKANPRNPTYRQFYRNHLRVLTSVHAGLLEQEDAVRTAETRRALGWNAQVDAYDAARFLSLCIPIVAVHDKLDNRQRKEAAHFYGDAAMKLLRDAVSKGYRDVSDMKKNTDLNPLHPREDFQKLIAELEGDKK
jgi:tetratricopeptide (TPR) repeat protein/tRNA A-37 threonylcarbamoyl transferase component Bud32